MLDSYAPVNHKYHQGVNFFYQIARNKRRRKKKRERGRERERNLLLTIYITFCFEWGR